MNKFPKCLAIMMVIWMLLLPSVFASDAKENQIHADIQKANHCQTNEDCIIPSFACPFSCGNYINKSEVPFLNQEITAYLQSSNRQCRNDCVRPVDPVCFNQKCAPTKCDPNKDYNLFACECSENTVIQGSINDHYKCVEGVSQIPSINNGIIDVEQLKKFKRDVESHDFWKMKNSGDLLFQKNSILPKEYKDLFSKYIKVQKNDVIIYEFYFAASPTNHTSAYVDLNVNSSDGRILNFVAMEERG
jgi:hypothetical protein